MADHKDFSRWRPHPWHGLEIGSNPPHIVYAYIELTPFDFVKYEIDKRTGYLFVDRPQRTSSQPPTLYGFIPRTYCGRRVGELSRYVDLGDGDPLDICVISERPIERAEILLNAHVVGGIHMIDHGEADDKIIAVLENDNFWGDVRDISELPQNLIQRLRHYFSTYKLMPNQDVDVSVKETYDSEAAKRVIRAAIEDYRETFVD